MPTSLVTSTTCTRALARARSHSSSTRSGSHPTRRRAAAGSTSHSVSSRRRPPRHRRARASTRGSASGSSTVRKSSPRSCGARRCALHLVVERLAGREEHAARAELAGARRARTRSCRSARRRRPGRRARLMRRRRSRAAPAAARATRDAARHRIVDDGAHQMADDGVLAGVAGLRAAARRGDDDAVGAGAGRGAPLRRLATPPSRTATCAPRRRARAFRAGPRRASGPTPRRAG